jgi:hypothetical protein
MYNINHQTREEWYDINKHTPTFNRLRLIKKQKQKQNNSKGKSIMHLFIFQQKQHTVNSLMKHILKKDLSVQHPSKPPPPHTMGPRNGAYIWKALEGLGRPWKALAPRFRAPGRGSYLLII